MAEFFFQLPVEGPLGGSGIVKGGITDYHWFLGGNPLNGQEPGIVWGVNGQLSNPKGRITATGDIRGQIPGGVE